MLQSPISKKYQAGTLGKLPVIVEEAPKEEEKGTQWWGPVLVLIAMAVFLWLVVPAFRPKKALPANQEPILPTAFKTNIQ